MRYRMKVVICNPNTPTNMNSDLMFDLNCEFCCTETDYGNGHHLSISGKDFSTLYCDIRYDKSFNCNKKENYLIEWANSYWSGKNDSYKVKDVKVIKM